MGTFKKKHLHAGEVIPTAKTPPRAIWVDLKALFGKIDESLLALAGKASQLVSWDRTHQFCGRCGNKTLYKSEERAKECTACHLTFYPKIAPVIMALVQREDEILLARGVHFPLPFYSSLAGFVEPGETLERCLKREVLEEVGIHVDDIEYFASQSWPFPHALMIAFTCRWKSGEISIDPSENLDAQWFRKESLPLFLLISAFRED